MLQSLCAWHKLPVVNDPGIVNLKATTEPAGLLRELKAGLPE
jgi:hypothetical protein